MVDSGVLQEPIPQLNLSYRVGCTSLPSSAMSSDSNNHRLYDLNLLSFDIHYIVYWHPKECRSDKRVVSDTLGPSVSYFNFC